MLPKNYGIHGIFIAVLCSVMTVTPIVKQANTPEFAVVNVLAPRYYADCCIEGSINIPSAQLEEYALLHWDKKNTQIVLYCANYHCSSSGHSAKQLMALGFEQVWAYEGGIAEWKHKGFPITGPAKESYLDRYFVRPDGMDEEKKEFNEIAAEELLQKIEEFAAK